MNALQTCASRPTMDVFTHSYSLDGKPLTSVSRVLDAIIKKSFDGVDPEVLRNAAERGTRVEQYATEWLATGGITVKDERVDVVERLEGFERFMQAMQPRLISAQQLVWDAEQGVAGTLDFLLDFNGVEWLCDMKCTAQPEASWALQVGAYCTLSGHDGPSAVLHLNPKFKGGYIWRVYDTAVVKRQWATALAWYKTLVEIKAAG